MTTGIRHVALLVISALVIGCSEKQDVGGGYSLVTGANSLNPDSHPGTALRRNGKIIWGNVYVGYYYAQAPQNFFHNGIFLFVGPFPDESGWVSFSQLFAVRGDGPPILLTERLVGRRLIISRRASDVSDMFSVRNISVVNGAVRVELDGAARPIELTLTAIENLFEEAATSGKTVHAQLGDYRVLPLQ